MRNSWRYFSLLVWSLALWGCSDIVPSSPTPQPTLPPIQDINCAEITRLYTIACEDSLNAVTIQSEIDTNITLSLAGINVTLDDTLFIRRENTMLSFTLVNGRSVIGSQSETRILQIRGTQVTVELSEQVFIATSPPSAVINAPASVLNVIPSHLLPRPMSVPQAIIVPRNNPTPDVQSNDDCSPPPTWNQFYSVQRGDSLYAIAQAHNVELSEILESNCITASVDIFPGDLLRVPDENNAEGVEVIFTAENATLATGECTQLSWRMSGVSLVYFQGEAVAQEESRDVCPQATTTYALLVIFNNGAQNGYTQTITVTP